MERCCKLLLVVVLAGAAVTAEAQDRGRRRSRRGDGDSSDDVRRQMQRADGLVPLFDSNHDGVIEPNEVHGQGRYVYERLAKQAGLDPTHSVSVGELRTALDRYFKKLIETRAKSPASKRGGSGDASGRDPSKQGKSGSAGDSASKVAGFGAPAETPKVAGFGQPASGGPAAAQPASSYSGSPGGSPAAGSSGSKPSQDKELDNRVQRYAESLLKRYDANKNGVLEKDEWSKMRNSPEKADRNRDSVVTSEELTAWLSDYGQKSAPSWSGSSSSSVSATPSRSTSSYHSPSTPRSGERKTFRFLTPTERLPKGLPDWFARKDANEDGQVSMAEFHSGDWDAAKVAEFAGYDRNNDGIITPAECLAGGKGE